MRGKHINSEIVTAIILKNTTIVKALEMETIAYTGITNGANEVAENVFSWRDIAVLLAIIATALFLGVIRFGGFQILINFFS